MYVDIEVDNTVKKNFPAADASPVLFGFGFSTSRISIHLESDPARAGRKSSYIWIQLELDENPVISGLQSSQRWIRIQAEKIDCCGFISGSAWIVFQSEPVTNPSFLKYSN